MIKRYTIRLLSVAQEVAIVHVKWQSVEEGAFWPAFKYACAVTSFTQLDNVTSDNRSPLWCSIKYSVSRQFHPPADTQVRIVLEGHIGHKASLGIFSPAREEWLISLLIQCSLNIFGRNAEFGHCVTCLICSPHCRHYVQTDEICNIPTLLDIEMASINALKRHFIVALYLSLVPLVVAHVVWSNECTAVSSIIVTVVQRLYIWPVVHWLILTLYSLWMTLGSE